MESLLKMNHAVIFPAAEVKPAVLRRDVFDHQTIQGGFVFGRGRLHPVPDVSVEDLGDAPFDLAVHLYVPVDDRRVEGAVQGEVSTQFRLDLGRVLSHGADQKRREEPPERPHGHKQSERWKGGGSEAALILNCHFLFRQPAVPCSRAKLSFTGCLSNQKRNLYPRARPLHQEAAALSCEYYLRFTEVLNQPESIEGSELSIKSAPGRSSRPKPVT